MTNAGDHEAMTAAEIDSLCEEFNCANNADQVNLGRPNGIKYLRALDETLAAARVIDN